MIKPTVIVTNSLEIHIFVDLLNMKGSDSL